MLAYKTILLALVSAPVTCLFAKYDFRGFKCCESQRMKCKLDPPWGHRGMISLDSFTLRLLHSQNSPVIALVAYLVFGFRFSTVEKVWFVIWMDLFFPLNDPFSLDITSYSEKQKSQQILIFIFWLNEILDANLN